MFPENNLRGRVFGSLTAMFWIRKASSGTWIWLCRCFCGRHSSVRASNLISSHTRSCGCLKVESTTTHGMRGSPEYSAWRAMIQRCRNGNHPEFENYGARGITVCDKWADSFEAFLSDMGVRPSSRHSIDRVNNEKGYSPENCRWATGSQQMRNTRGNHWIEIDGQRKLITDWAIEKDIHFTTICHRIERGMSERDAVLMPPRFGVRRASNRAA